MELLEEFAVERNGNNLEKIHDLQIELITNVIDLEAITENIQALILKDSENFDDLEDLYFKEFKLYMNNISIYEDLMSYIEKEPITSDNEFELAKIKRDADNMLRVEVIDL